MLPADWQQFTRMLARKGKARIAVSSALMHAGQVVGTFTGEFVALGGAGVLAVAQGASE